MARTTRTARSTDSTARNGTPVRAAGRTDHRAGPAFPAPRPLATPTDLSPANVRAITDAVNPIIADAFALYLKTKNFHWHLAGVHFRDLHVLFDEQAEQIFASIDDLAERVRRIGGTTLRSISHVSELQTIRDDNDDFVDAPEMVRRLMDDNRHITGQLRQAIDIVEENRDKATGSLLQDVIDQTERRTWFLFEIAQGLPEKR